MKHVQIGQTYNIYNFVKKCDFFVLRSGKVKRMIPEHAMDLFIEKSQVEICVLLKIKFTAAGKVRYIGLLSMMYHQWPSLQFAHCTDKHDNAGHGVIVLAQWFDNYIE